MSGDSVRCRERPCETCPYRKDVPSGLWSADEYRKLPEYDELTGEQPIAAFYCHTASNFLCTGWAVCHTNRGSATDLMALRILAAVTQEPVVIPETDIPLFASGREAALHGMRDIRRPGKRALDAVQKIERMRKRRGEKTPYA